MGNQSCSSSSRSNSQENRKLFPIISFRELTNYIFARNCRPSSVVESRDDITVRFLSRFFVRAIYLSAANLRLPNEWFRMIDRSIHIYSTKELFSLSTKKFLELSRTRGILESSTWQWIGKFQETRVK